MITQEEFEDKWQGKIVKPLGHYKIPDKEYFVTAALLDQPSGNKLAIMATDYTPENKQWITIDLADEEVELLDERFEILGDYNNIESESINEIIKVESLNETEENVTMRIYRFPQYVENKEEPLEFEQTILCPKGHWRSGTKLYLFMFRTTSGETRTMGFNLENRKHESNEEIFHNLKQVRSWIKTGVYWIGNPKFI